jgi:hypothetical protein
MKASKKIMGLFLALFILISGVCVGDDAFDILDFVPVFTKRAKFGNAVAKPFFIVPGVSTPVTITAYIPDADLVPGSVQLKDGNAVIGNLTDTGNKVFSITNNFQRDNGGAIKLSIAATFGTVNKTIAQFEIKVLSLPTIQDATQYNQNVDNIFSTLVATRDNFATLQDPSISAGQFSNNLSTARDRLLSVYASMEAIYRHETHSPSNFPLWVDEHTGFGGMIQNGQDSLDVYDLFLNADNAKRLHDPRIADILAYAYSIGETDETLSNYQTRKDFIDAYHIGGYNYRFRINTLQAANNTIVKQLVGQFTGLAGGAIGDLFGGIKGWLISKGINAGISKIIDIFISSNGQIGMAVVELQDGETLEVPVGSHDILYSFKGVSI